jgi:hypothetical protein
VDGVSTSGDVAFTPPAGWVRVDFAPPDLGAGASVVVESWSAWRAPLDDAPHVIGGCVGLDVSTWTDEATPIAEGRLAGMAQSTLTRLDLPDALTVIREDRGAVVAQEWLGQDGVASARTFLGFTSRAGQPHLEGCFIVCAPHTRPCADAMSLASPTSAFVPPPATSAPLRAVVFAVHHSRAVATCGIALFFVAGVLAVWTRPRPRRK